MDTLDYGLSSPQLALMNNGAVFVAGQVQAPMTPPTQTQSKSGLMMANKLTAADNSGTNSIFVGSNLVATTGSFAPGFGPLFMNQGVDRMVATTNDQIFNGTTIVGEDWRSGVPRIAGRHTLFHGQISAMQPISPADAAKLRYDVYVGSTSTAFLADQVLVNTNSSNWSWVPWANKNQDQWGYVFDIPAAQAIANANITIKLKDPTGTVLAPGVWQQNDLVFQPKNADGTVQSPWVDSPKGIKVILVPVTLQYEDSTGVSHSFSPTTTLAAYQGQLDAALRKVFPFSDGGISYDLNSQGVQLIWDLGTQSSSTQFAPPYGSNSGTLQMGSFGGGGDWNDLTTYALSTIAPKYNQMQPQQAGTFACVVIPTISGVTQPSGSYVAGWTMSCSTGTGDFSHCFAVLDFKPINGAHELGHANQCHHTFDGLTNIFWTGWPGGSLYGAAAQGASQIGVPAWDPWYSSGSSSATPLNYFLNSGSVGSPLWGFQAFDPTSGIGTTSKVIDLMDYQDPPTELKWISDYTFKVIFIYNNFSNQ